MENNYPTYNSGDSSPRSREIDLEHPAPSWEEQPLQNHKVKLMVSYNGKIQPLSHDNNLHYVGGETKILTIDRTIKFSSFYSKLASLTSSDYTDVARAFTCKYQLPGEDLDALISVSNDEDVEYMMQEYDRMFRASLKPVRLRLFLSSDRHHPLDHNHNHNQKAAAAAQGNNTDFFFGLDKVPVTHHQVTCPTRVPVQAPVLAIKGVEQVPESELINALNRLKICEQKQSAMYPQEIINDNFVDTYRRTPVPVNPAPFQNPHQQHQQQQMQQPVYMVHPPQQANVYHAPSNGQVQQNKGYYQPVYSMPPMAPPVSAPVYTMPPPVPPVSAPLYTMPPPVLPVSAPAAQARSVMTAQLGHDGAAERKVYYAAAPMSGAVSSAYPTVVTVASSEMRGGGDGKLVQKVILSSAGVLERPLLR